MHFREERYRGGALRTSASHPEKPIVQPRGFGTRWRFPLEPTLSAARASIATISGSVSGTADHPEGGSGAESSSPDRSGSPSDAAIDIRSSGGAPKDTSGTPLEGPASSLGSSTGCEVPVERGALEGWFLGGEFLTVTVRPVRLLPEVAPPRLPPGGALDLGRGTGTPPPWRKRSLVRNSATVILPHWEHDSSTKAASACLMPRHERQRS